jgi:DNA-damage-inducible protein J
MKTTTSVKLDKEIKDQATKLASELGLNLSSVINATLKKFVIERRIVFSASPEFNTKTKKEFLGIIDDIKRNNNIVGPFDNIDDLKKSLTS